MNAYIILIFCIMFLWCSTKGGKIYCRISSLNFAYVNLFLWLSFFVAFLIPAMRNENVGVDTDNYILYYENVGELSWNGLWAGEWDNRFFTTEKGYMILEKICKDLMIPSQLFIALCAGIYIYGVYSLIRKYVKYSLLLSVVSFLAIGSYLLSFNAMRQAIGVGICCIAWGHLKNRKQKLFLCEVLLACTFHISCCVFFIALVFEKIPASKKSIIFSMIGILGFGFLGTGVLQSVIRWFPLYASRYGHGKWEISEVNGIVAVWVIMILLVLLLAFRKDWKREGSHIDFEIILFSLCYISINIIGLSFDGAQRLSMLFQPFLVLLFDRSCSLWGGKKRILYTVCVIAGMLVLFIRASATTQYVYLPFWA